MPRALSGSFENVDIDGWFCGEGCLSRDGQWRRRSLSLQHGDGREGSQGGVGGCREWKTNKSGGNLYPAVACHELTRCVTRNTDASPDFLQKLKRTRKWKVMVPRFKRPRRERKSISFQIAISSQSSSLSHIPTTVLNYSLHKRRRTAYTMHVKVRRHLPRDTTSRSRHPLL